MIKQNIIRPKVGDAIYMLNKHQEHVANIAEIRAAQEEPDGRVIPLDHGDSLRIWFVKLDKPIFWNDLYPAIFNISVHWSDRLHKWLAIALSE